MKYYLAIDIGASSGRHILGHIENGRLVTEEIHRFENGVREKNGHLCWDVERLFSEILAGMKKAGDIGKIPDSTGIDTWGVDFVLLDKSGAVLGDSVSYRDSRTKGADGGVFCRISPEELYRRTGIQRQPFNTIFQLAVIARDDPEQLREADKLLMYPDYFNYLLTGLAAQEYTNATTTQLVNAESGGWDTELIERLGFPQRIFQSVKPAGHVLGTLLPDIAAQVGYQTKIVLPASHDTGSAVAAISSPGEDTLFISSGTWSLMGVERSFPELSELSREHNFTNEGGYLHRFRFLKNIMGLWMIQNVRRENADRYSFSELCDIAEQSEITSIVDCQSEEFLAPDSMTAAIFEYCRRTGQLVPQNVGDTARVIYRSLADCYAKTAAEIEFITGQKYDVINVIGGGSRADFLNRLTARASGKKVLAGPAEATAIGNLLVQALTAGEFTNLAAARECVRNSFEIKEYLP